ncbi:hypothetical protein LEP1GSC016_2668 [Leptospira borgpetersenii serovar Hardjo-bovis str. Sponselee]|uniref:Uncharacterized protein n=1 Tax=Leptospira borgpetersenii serovar Hardjo-bovis str. Sponselee TaxID=1303729 RepID=M6BQM7_LEPBO|nr:hypothetical protein LEP1GSC016_2668 [Leptospira borgpetersenii serovar Hardjo-bovis str. Sponselee]
MKFVETFCWPKLRSPDHISYFKTLSLQTIEMQERSDGLPYRWNEFIQKN